MKKLILLGLCIFLFLGIVSAATYEQDKELDLKVPCINNNTFCSSSATCNLTILYPNSSNLVYGQAMTNAGTYHNYSLTPSQTSIIGKHTVTAVCADGSDGGYTTFTYDINPMGKEPSGSAGSFAIAVIIAMIAGAALCFFLGHMFKSEDQRWYNFMLRSIFYMFSIGFVMLAIGGLNQLATETDVGGRTEITNIITGGVTLISRLQYFFFVLIFIFFLVWFVEFLLLRKKSKDEGRFNR